MATLLVRVLPPPTPSTCTRSDAPMAPISASSRATSSSGSHSRRKNGPREVPPRISTQGTTRVVESVITHTTTPSYISPDSTCPEGRAGPPQVAAEQGSSGEPVEDAVDHHSGLAEVVGRVEQLRQRI